ncbi:hypothetical protein DNTS_023925 [Danionella cerebrum]|uniref:Uncharacterized protein n=1 Tax=Danionella cerebrum TaxID=2873325 RepID=A0A553MV06_9TELE|nr:hypothetical protein DNTS_023925 [Danionella translucida]
MLSFLRGAVQPGMVLRTRDVFHRSNSTILSKPAIEKIGPEQTPLVMCVFAAALLGPAGWILHHIPEY